MPAAVPQSLPHRLPAALPQGLPHRVPVITSHYITSLHHGLLHTKRPSARENKQHQLGMDEATDDDDDDNDGDDDHDDDRNSGNEDDDGGDGETANNTK